MEACRAVKRLQISQHDLGSHHVQQVWFLKLSLVASTSAPCTCGHDVSLDKLQDQTADSRQASPDLVSSVQHLHLQQQSPTQRRQDSEANIALQGPSEVLLQYLSAVLLSCTNMLTKELELQSPADAPANEDEHSCGIRDVLPKQTPPQRFLSSPDMSRFKFRLTSSKPPVHPVSSRTLFRQQSAALADELQVASTKAVTLKNTHDRHSEQERLFHQLDRKLTLHAPQQQPLSPRHSRHVSPFPPLVMAASAAANTQALQAATSPQVADCVQQPSIASSSAATASFSAETASCSAGTASFSDGAASSAGKGISSAVISATTSLQASEEDDRKSSEELCQPSTPIRREDSLPTRNDQEQALAESVFAAMYEQTNMLLRNLHFERLSRRATTPA